MSLSVRHALMGAVLVLAAMPAYAAPSGPDAQFARNAAQGGLAEVKMAQLALSKSKNSTVRAFAHHMIADHTPNNARLAAIMRSEGLTVPAMVDPNSQMMMSRLQGLSGRAFDRAYMAGQVRSHGQMQILMQSETNGGKDARLRAYAKTTLSAVNEHLAMARTDVAMLRSGRMAGTMSGGSMSGGAMSGGNMSGGNMSGGTTSGGNMGGNTSGGSMSGGSTSGGNMPGGNMPGGTSGGAPAGGTSAGGASSGGSTTGPGTTSSPAGMGGASPMPMPSSSPRPR